MSDRKNIETAVFGGGCFWCYEAIFARLRGVESAVSGYAGGAPEKAKYDYVSMGKTGHAEVVQVTFDPSVISYRELLDIFFHVHDPTQMNRQGADIGTQYRSVIFYVNDAQHEGAEAMIRQLSASGEFDEPIATVLEPLDAFYTAEAYHQKYFDLNPDAPYCSVIIQPKVAKFLEKYKNLVK